jgi:hypothetical protein
MADRTYCQIQIAAARSSNQSSKRGVSTRSTRGTDGLGNPVAGESDPCLFEDSDSDHVGDALLKELRATGHRSPRYYKAGDAYGSAVFVFDGSTYAESPGNGPASQKAA